MRCYVPQNRMERRTTTMGDEVTRLAQSVLALDKGVEEKRAELGRMSGLVLEAKRTRDELDMAVTRRTSEKNALEIAVAELQRDQRVLVEQKAKLTDEIARLTQAYDTLQGELTALRQRVGI